MEIARSGRTRYHLLALLFYFALLFLHFVFCRVYSQAVIPLKILPLLNLIKASVFIINSFFYMYKRNDRRKIWFIIVLGVNKLNIDGVLDSAKNAFFMSLAHSKGLTYKH